MIEAFDIHFMHDFDFFPKNQNWWFFIFKYFKELDQWLFNENSKNHTTLPRSSSNNFKLLENIKI